MEGITSNNKNINNSTNYGRAAITMLLVSTIIQAYFGYARDASTFFKVVIALGCWGGIILSGLKVRSSTYYPKTMIAVIGGMAICIVWAILKTIVLGQVYEGNKYAVLLGNMYGALDLMGIAFIFAVESFEEIRFFKNATIAMIFVAIILLFINYDVTIESYCLTYVCSFMPVFFPYVSTRDKAILIIGLLLSAFCYYGGGRQAAIIFVFAVGSVLCASLCSKKIAFYLSLIIALSPFLFMFLSMKWGSIIELALQNIQLGEYMQIETEDVTADSRTFLWMELFADFSGQNTFTQLFGQGAVAYYNSIFFNLPHRLGIEIPMLQWLMQAGIIYIILFTFLTYYVIWRLYKAGNNTLCKISSILIAGYYFNCYISNLIGCSIMQLGVFFLFSVAFNNRLLELDDKYLRIAMREKVDIVFLEDDGIDAENEV